MRDGLGLDAWWDELAKQATAVTGSQRGMFILRKLREHDETRLRTVMKDLYGGSDWPDPQDMGRFEWQVILAYMGANAEEIRDVQKRMGRV